MPPVEVTWIVGVNAHEIGLDVGEDVQQHIEGAVLALVGVTLQGALDHELKGAQPYALVIDEGSPRVEGVLPLIHRLAKHALEVGGGIAVVVAALQAFLF